MVNTYLVSTLNPYSKFISAIVREESPEEAIRLLRGTYAYADMVKNLELNAEEINIGTSVGVYYAVVRKSYG